MRVKQLSRGGGEDEDAPRYQEQPCLGEMWAWWYNLVQYIFAGMIVPGRIVTMLLKTEKMYNSHADLIYSDDGAEMYLTPHTNIISCWLLIAILDPS